MNQNGWTALAVELGQMAEFARRRADGATTRPEDRGDWDLVRAWAAEMAKQAMAQRAADERGRT